MFRLRSVCLMCLSVALAGCQHYDKAAHFAVGAIVSEVVSTQTDNKAAGCAAAIGVGILKEMVDEVADPLDAIATGFGCTVSYAF